MPLFYVLSSTFFMHCFSFITFLSFISCMHSILSLHAFLLYLSSFLSLIPFFFPSVIHSFYSIFFLSSLSFISFFPFLPSFPSFLFPSFIHSLWSPFFILPSFHSFCFPPFRTPFFHFNHSIVPSSHSFIPHLFSPRQEARNTTSNLSTLKKHYTPHQPQRSLHVYTLSMTTQC